MISTSYMDQNFNFISDRLSYTIRGEVVLEEEIDGLLLLNAVNTSFKRYPYFCVRLISDGNKYTPVYNPLPHVVPYTNDRVILGSEDTNYHLIVVSYYENRIFFNVSHCLTDGAGRMPLTKTVLYYYLGKKYSQNLNPEGINLADSAMFPDEDAEPYITDIQVESEPSSFVKIGKAYKLTQGGRISDNYQTEYRFRIDEKAFMNLCRQVKATPNSLVPVLLARSAKSLDPAIHDNVAVNLCINMRQALNCPHSHLLLLSCIPIIFKPDEIENGLLPMCCLVRESIRSQTSPENIRFIYRKTLKQAEKIRRIKSLDRRRRIMNAGVYGEEGFLSSTFISSYVGRADLGSLAPYVRAMYTAVDAIPQGGAIIEITATGGYFNFSLMQDFSSPDYTDELIHQMEIPGLTVEKIGSSPIKTPLLKLPETTCL